MCLQRRYSENTVGKGETARNKKYLEIDYNSMVQINAMRVQITFGVLRGSVVKCLTRNPGVLGLSCTGSSEFFVGLSLGKTLQSPSLVLVKPRKDMNYVSCCRDMIEIPLRAK